MGRVRSYNAGAAPAAALRWRSRAMTTRILLIEDDGKLAPLVREFLVDQGYEVSWAADGTRGLELFAELRPDLVVLDLMLPGVDGLTLCRHIRAEGQTAVLILTARGDEMDRVLGLELGADDYLTKPFGLKELLARIRAVLRRYHAEARQVGRPERRVGPFHIDLDQRSLERDGVAVSLTRSEFDILELLTRRPGRVLTRDDLLQQVRGGETAAFDRAVDTHISNLRKKLEPDPKHPRFLVTVWGVGYRWSEA